ncbi:hypothetical protein P3W53_26070 [Pseudomonas denitrificans (nom. rej.)]|nr:hypothetical protein [Pseudomonas denitrificans (nom. rej.)]
MNNCYRACLKVQSAVNVAQVFHSLRTYLRNAGLNNPQYKWVKDVSGDTFIVVTSDRDAILRLTVSKLEDAGAVVIARLKQDIIDVMKKVTPTGGAYRRRSVGYGGDYT